MKQRRPKARIPVKKANPVRKAAAFAKAFHSHERVSFCQSLPCLCCGCRSQNAHVGTGGAGLRSPYTDIVPLCSVHHDELHRAGRVTFERKYRLDLTAHAARTEARWQASQEYRHA